MPMFQALKKCPDAVVVKPRMDVYAAVSKEIRKMMEELTPAIEPLSLMRHSWTCAEPKIAWPSCCDVGAVGQTDER